MLKEGDKAPLFSLPADDGSEMSLRDFPGKTVILFFYPKDMTPGCTQEACDFRDSWSRISKKKAVVLGISRDSVERHAKFKEKHELCFPLLADDSGEVTRAYGVWKQKSMYGKKFYGIERTTFIVNPEGRIQKIFPKVSVKGHVEAVLKALNE